MITIYAPRFNGRWPYALAAGMLIAALGGYQLLNESHQGVPNAQRTDAVAPVAHRTSPQLPTRSPESTSQFPKREIGQGGNLASNAHHTGMEDWQRPENAALHLELQRWYDHREETSPAQRRADASALTAKVEAKQATGQLSQTSAALAHLMLLQGAPSDDPEHAKRLKQVLKLLSGQLSFGE